MMSTYELAIAFLTSNSIMQSSTDEVITTTKVSSNRVDSS